MRKRNLTFWILLIVCVIVYCVSCCLPCYSTVYETTKGYLCLVGGWTFLFWDFWLFLIWFSNVLFIYSIIMVVRNNTKSFWTSIFASVLALSMFLHKYILYGKVVPITNFHIGYYLWCSSHLILLLVSFLSWYREKTD